MKFTPDIETFAAQRRASQDRAIADLREVVRDALGAFGADGWSDEILARAADIWVVTQEADGGNVPLPDAFLAALSASLDQTSTPASPPDQAQVERVATWVAVFTINASTDALATAEQADQDDLVLREWVTMLDPEVRDLHRPLHGEQQPVGEPFQVGPSQLLFPGQPIGPPEVWINCRCVIRPVLGGNMVAAAVTEEAGEPEIAEDEIDQLMAEADLDPGVIPIHGVLVDNTEETGDGRHIAGETSVLAVEDGPMAIRWVKFDEGEHKGAVRVGTLTQSWREGDRVLWNGHLMDTPEAAEVLGLLAEGRVGLSVDMDDVEFEVDEEAGVARVLSGRIRAATLVDTPALTSAWAQLGTWQDVLMLAAAGCEPCQSQMRYRTFQISEEPWDGSPSRFTDEQWIRSTVVDRGAEFETAKTRYAVPIREPGGALSRAAVHNAAARINQVDAPASAIAAGKRALVRAYGELEEEAPESLTGASEAFQIPGIPPRTMDAPGWITHPRETARLRRYWTEGAGAAKIRWGAPGDFNRCRTQLAKYVQRPDHLAGLCANMHFDALGFWPGAHARLTSGALVASAFTIYQEETPVLPAEWFANPNLPMPTPVTVTKEGRVFGHIAQWGVCHTGLGLSVGMDDVCTTAPRSVSDYAFFRTGVVETTAGDVAVGNLTMGIGHAGDRMSAQAAASHYDNTGTVVADVAAGEDAHGIWFSGAMRPDLSDEQIRAFKAATLSGDWRTIDGSYELVAALAVNVPGFPIPRVSISASAGRQTALRAAGIVPPDSQWRPDVAALAKEVEQELARRQRTRDLKKKVKLARRAELATRI